MIADVSLKSILNLLTDTTFFHYSPKIMLIISLVQLSFLWIHLSLIIDVIENESATLIKNSIKKVNICNLGSLTLVLLRSDNKGQTVQCPNDI